MKIRDKSVKEDTAPPPCRQHEPPRSPRSTASPRSLEMSHPDFRVCGSAPPPGGGTRSGGAGLDLGRYFCKKPLRVFHASLRRFVTRGPAVGFFVVWTRGMAPAD